MGKLIAVQGCVLQIMNGEGVAVITTPPLTDIKVCGLPPYAGPLSIQITAGSIGSITNGDAMGAGVLMPTAQFSTWDGKAPVCKGDMVQIPVNGTTGPKHDSATDVAIVKIASAGQTFVKTD